MAFEEAFEVFKSKAPIRLPGAQKAARNAWLYIEHAILQSECSQLTIALDHSLHKGEGRHEFDLLLQAIEARLEREGFLPNR